MADLDKILAGAAPNTDDVPTMISKSPPTQGVLALNGADSSLSNSLRGRTLAHFELLEPIGVGGMAAVIRARDKQLDRFVALKILPPEMAVDPENVQRFHQEARAAAKLDHENIARVYFCGDDQKLHFIAFEFVEGQNLRMVMEERGRLPVKDAVSYLLQIATGLAHAASRGVVHRDIKPSNIIITPNGRAKLVDMGLARSLAPHDNRQLTQSGVTLGTFDYISPEQALEPRDADVRSDIYSLGCTFYHALTGQPPVPEGTAAKKLHHHQHVAPFDPRQLNAEIPDELAVILHRMMAKDPKERYQRAEHLVQHLLQLTQKIGGAEMPDGVFFVDAALPAPPRKRSVVLAGMAVAVLIVFVLAVAALPPPAATVPPSRVKMPVAAAKDDAAKMAAAGVSKDSPALEPRKVANEKEFSDALNEDRIQKIILHQDILPGETAWVYRGGLSGKRSLVIESEDRKKPAALQFSYVLDPENPTPFWAGLTIEGGSVTFHHVQFVLEAGYTPPQLAAGVAVKGGQVVFDHCTFFQQTPDEELIAKRGFWPVASVAAWNTTLERPPVVFRHCWFANGQTAVSVKGGAKVEVDDCAFGPHSCLFHVWGEDKDDRADLFLTHVSAQVVNGPVFRLDDNSSCTLGVQYSIFSCPTNGSLRDRPDLIRQTGALRDVKYEGKRNGYHQLMSFWAAPGQGKDEVDGADWATFKARIALAPAAGGDAGSSLLKTNPWPKASEGDARAFAIDLKMPELRQENDKKNRPIGVEAAVWGALYPTGGLPALESAHPVDVAFKLGPKERLVDPSGAESGARIHKKIEAAVSEADADDVILIKHNGELRIEPTSLTDLRHIKLKAFAGFQPILVLGKTVEKTPALFALHHSQIEFEQLEFLLRADAKHTSQSIVNVGGDSTCKFDECVITLDNADSPNHDLDVVALLNPRETTKVGSESKLRADVRFRGCFVRGRGDLVNVRASRPLDLDINASLVCLAGSLLTVHAGTGDTLPADLRSNVRLHKMTSYLGDPALHLIAGKQSRGLISTQVKATDCLFGVSGVKPLVRVEGLEIENQLKKLLGWTGSSNAYAGFDKLLEQTALDGGTALAYQADDWKRFTEAGSGTRFERTALQPTGTTERPFQLWLPNDFTQRSELSLFGAAIETLPQPRALVSGRDF